jgi:hypothetical protein
MQSLSRLAKALRLSLVLHGSGAQVRLAHAVAQVVRTAHGVFWYENGAAVDLGGEEALYNKDGSKVQPAVRRMLAQRVRAWHCAFRRRMPPAGRGGGATASVCMSLSIS